MNQFVETKKLVKRVIDGELSNGAWISVIPDEDNSIGLLIGTPYSNRDDSFFSKVDIAELIAVLQEIHNAMDD